MPFTEIRYEIAEGVATVTLNRPEKLNALTLTMLRKLGEAFEQADADDEVRAVVVTGAGRAFCAGADLSGGGSTFEASIVRDGDSYVINGHKWWSSGIGDPRCKILIFMGKTDPKNPDRYKQQSMILVQRDAPGIKVVRMLTVFGYDDAPHGHGEALDGEARSSYDRRRIRTASVPGNRSASFFRR